MGEGRFPSTHNGETTPSAWESKPRQRSWQISDPEFQKTLQFARAVCPANRMGEQHAIITCMTKHKKQQNCAKSTPPFTLHDTARYHKGSCRYYASLDSKRICMPTSRKVIAWWHTKSTWRRFLHLYEKDLTQRRCSSLQTIILAPICSVKLVQHPDQCWIP